MFSHSSSGFNSHFLPPQSQCRQIIQDNIASSRGHQLKELMKQSNHSICLQPQYKLTNSNNPVSCSKIANEQVSMLVRLQQSLKQRPSFEELFLMEQQKKHLWELLALKEETLQKLQLKLKDQVNKCQKVRKQLNAKDQTINKLKQVINKGKQRQKQLQTQLNRVLEIKNNIIQEFNIIKQQIQTKTHTNTHLSANTNLSANPNISAPKHQLKLPENLAPQIQTQTHDQQHLNTSEISTLKQQITLLKQQNFTLISNNSQLKQSLDQVLKQLRNIQLEVIQNFNCIRPYSSTLANKTHKSPSLSAQKPNSSQQTPFFPTSILAIPNLKQRPPLQQIHASNVVCQNEAKAPKMRSKQSSSIQIGPKELPKLR